jgi:hypothetical protein
MLLTDDRVENKFLEIESETFLATLNVSLSNIFDEFNKQVRLGDVACRYKLMAFEIARGKLDDIFFKRSGVVKTLGIQSKVLVAMHSGLFSFMDMIGTHFVFNRYHRMRHPVRDFIDSMVLEAFEFFPIVRSLRLMEPFNYQNYHAVQTIAGLLLFSDFMKDKDMYESFHMYDILIQNLQMLPLYRESYAARFYEFNDAELTIEGFIADFGLSNMYMYFNPPRESESEASINIYLKFVSDYISKLGYDPIFA